MYKTTLYLPKSDILRLRKLSTNTPRQGLTHHIQRAVREYLARKPRRIKPADGWMRCKGMSRRSTFGDAVTYQRKLRREWS